MIERLYGPPAFANTVNIRKTVDGPVGWYSPSTNELALRSLEGDVLIHELVHAFHDDFMLALASWEEGMARAIEVEVSKRVGIPSEQDHNYDYDVYYEALNRPEVDASQGNIFAGWNQVLMRYQLAGYAWGKALIEDENSLVRFNEVLYALARADLTITSDEAALVQAAESVFVSVEDRPFSEWYAAQHVFDTFPPEGEFLFIRNSGVNNLWVAPFSRDASGVETTITDADIQWVVKDHAGSVIVRGSGAMIFDPVLSGYWSTMGYEGRIEITAEAVLSGQSRSSTVYDKASPSSGIFGVVLGADDGSITLTPLDGGTAVTAAVEKGTFQASDMTTVRGRVEYVFTDLAGVSTAPRVVTKDNAPYFLLIDVRGTPENDCPGHEPVPHKPHPPPRGGKHWRHPHKQ